MGLGGDPAELRHPVVVRRNSDVTWWSGVTPGLRWWSGETPASDGDPAELRRLVVVRCNSGSQVVVRRNSGVRRWSGGSPTELQRRVVIRRNSGVKWWSGGLRRWSRRSLFLLFLSSSFLLLFFSSCFGPPLMGNDGPIYSFFRVAWPVNKRKIMDIFGVI
ncbi:hypothetical protein M5K25_026323 [Dendrobium thyrsiflorum]|uniref:Uncharacterized protein n=1 Tax=Dendrobium thyrsiflorum TaxID=117978 RepID=A0ABD0TX59_DENTH